MFNFVILKPYEILRSMIDHDKVVENIKKLRMARGLSSMEIARRLSISAPAYSNIEKKKTSITLDRINSLSKIFDVKPETILFGTDVLADQENEKIWTMLMGVYSFLFRLQKVFQDEQIISKDYSEVTLDELNKLWKTPDIREPDFYSNFTQAKGKQGYPYEFGMTMDSINDALTMLSFYIKREIDDKLR